MGYYSTGTYIATYTLVMAVSIGKQKDNAFFKFIKKKFNNKLWLNPAREKISVVGFNWLLP